MIWEIGVSNVLTACAMGCGLLFIHVIQLPPWAVPFIATALGYGLSYYLTRRKGGLF